MSLDLILNEPSKSSLVEVTRGAELLAAPSLHWEVGNALSALFKRRRIDMDQAKAALESYESIPIRLADVDLGPSVALSEKSHGVYAHDAYVIEMCASVSDTASVTGPRAV